MKLPGFIDSHLHVLGLGYTSYNVDLTDVSSIAELKTKLKVCKDKNLIIGRGWNQENLLEKRMITKSDLNEVSNDIPILLVRVCGHVIVVNDKLMEIAGVNSSTKAITGGTFAFDTGIFSEHALGLIYNKLPLPTKADIKKFLIKADQLLITNGITSVASDDFAIFPIPFEEIIDIINDLYKKDLLHVRITEQVNLNYNNLERFIAKGYVNKTFGKFRMGPLKILVDGSLGGKTAYLSKPYVGEPENFGVKTYSDEDLFKLVNLADANGMDVVIHAIGDAASEQAINCLVKSLKQTNRINHNHAIIHAQLTTKAQIETMKKWNIGAIVQPIFLNSDIQIIEARIGERSIESYLFKTMYTNGLTVGFSTDAPIEPVNPFWNIYCAMTRSSVKHKELNAFLKEEAFDWEEALGCYTTNNLRFVYQDRLFEEDYIITDRDFLDEKSLLDMLVLKTVIDGKTVFELK